MNNSLQGLLGQLFRSNKNSIEILEKLSLLYQTTSDAVTINYIDDENVERNIIIPSYTFLISEIKRLNNNFENVSGVGIKKAGIKLSDGSYRTIFSNEVFAYLNPAGAGVTSIAAATKPTFAPTSSPNTLAKLTVQWQNIGGGTFRLVVLDYNNVTGVS